MNLKNRILIYSHDAGGANLAMAYAYYMDKLGYEVKCFPKGPAIKIFKNHISHLICNENIEFNRSDIVATGTSGIHSEYEMQLIRSVKKKVSKVITFLDNTDEIIERFLYNNNLLEEEFLPTEIWYEKNISFKDYPFIENRIIFHENLYIKYLKDVFYKEKIKIQNKDILTFKNEYLLILTEYISELFGNTFGFDEYDFLKHILNEIVKLNLNIPIFLKLHPAERSDKFDDILRNYDLKIYKDDYNIQEVLYFSKLVFGLNSSVFKEALLLNKPIYSIQIGAKKNLETIDTVQVIKKSKELKEVLIKNF